MKIFLDTEFTGLFQNAELISIGVVSEDGRTFYAESTQCDRLRVDEWIRENVITCLRFSGYESRPSIDFDHHAEYTSNQMIACDLEEWLSQFDCVEVWSDCLAYDWVLFCQLFGGAMKIPKNVYYIPFDLATLLKVKGIDPDINREDFAGLKGKKHNALRDAKTIKACFEKAIGL